jgi:hypothetical protein
VKPLARVVFDHRSLKDALMATRTTVLLEDDLDGGTADETVTFGVDGAAYEIDLSTKNATKLRQALAAFVNAGRRTGRVSRSTPRNGVPRQSSGSDQDSAAIRVWARENGYEVSERGRIPAIVRAAYRSAR